MSKLRISHLIVQAVLVYDDGEELTPGPQLNPIQLPLSKLGEFGASLPAEVAALEAKLAEETPDETAP